MTECVDESGNRVRLNRGQIRDHRRTQTLKTLGCSTRAIGTGPVTDPEINCFQRFFGLNEGPLDEVSRDLLDRLIAGSLEQNLKIARRLNHVPGGGLDETGRPTGAIDPLKIVRGHPDAALFVHPARSRVADATAFGDLADVTSGKPGLWAEVRWPDLPDFAGREFSVTGKGFPLFVFRLKENVGEIETPGGSVHSASYQRNGEFVCVPGGDALQGRCVGLAVQYPPGGRAAWQMRPALHGKQGIIVFGTLSEGREAFDLAVSSPPSSISTERTIQRVPDDKMAETLPLDGVEGWVAHYVNQIYKAPVAPDTEFFSQARIPFLAYHGVYAQVCTQEFDGQSTIWRDIGERLVESSDVPGNRYRVYEKYIMSEMPIQSDYYQQFALGIEEWRGGWLRESSRAQKYYPFFVDFLAMLQKRFDEWGEGWRQVIAVTGCKGPTVDRLEKNLAESYEMIPS